MYFVIKATIATPLDFDIFTGVPTPVDNLNQFTWSQFAHLSF